MTIGWITRPWPQLPLPHIHNHQLDRFKGIQIVAQCKEVTPAEVAEELLKSENVEVVLDRLVTFLKGKKKDAVETNDGIDEAASETNEGIDEDADGTNEGIDEDVDGTNEWFDEDVDGTNEWIADEDNEALEVAMDQIMSLFKGHIY
ncbi:hypothetical protein Tco_1395716 [Tanacetum coccineum]